jgi:hypothetical protein
MDNELAKRLDPLLGWHGERLTMETLRKASGVKVRMWVLWSLDR